MSTYLLKELVGTKSQSFKVGGHKLMSNGAAVTFADSEYGVTLLQVAPALLQISEQSFYWGNAPLTTGSHNVGDIVWNINQDNPDNILCWRCIQSGSPGVWSPQHTHSLQLPKTAPASSIAQYKDGAWTAITVEELEISADQVTETPNKKFVTAEQISNLDNLSGVNTGDETRESILNKIGKADSERHGYLSNVDYNKLISAFEAASNPNTAIGSASPTKISDLVNDVEVAFKSDIPTDVSDLYNDAGYITENELPTKVSQLENDIEYVVDQQLPKKTSDLINDSNYITINELDSLTLNQLVDVDVSSSVLADDCVLTYKVYLDKWVPTKLNGDVISSSGTSSSFNVKDANTWAANYLPTVSLSILKDVEITTKQEGALLTYKDGVWQSVSPSNISSLELDALSDVMLSGSQVNFSVLTLNNGVWQNIQLKNNPDFNINNLAGTRLINVKNNEVLTYDSANRLWVNKSLSSALESSEVGSLKGLSDVIIPDAGLLDGATLTFNSFLNKWVSRNRVVDGNDNTIDSYGESYTDEKVTEVVNRILVRSGLSTLTSGGKLSLNDIVYKGNSATFQDESIPVYSDDSDAWYGRPLSDLLDLYIDAPPQVISLSPGTGGLFYWCATQGYTRSFDQVKNRPPFSIYENYIHLEVMKGAFNSVDHAEYVDSVNDYVLGEPLGLTPVSTWLTRDDVMRMEKNFYANYPKIFSPVDTIRSYYQNLFPSVNPLNVSEYVHNTSFANEGEYDPLNAAVTQTYLSPPSYKSLFRFDFTGSCIFRFYIDGRPEESNKFFKLVPYEGNIRKKMYVNLIEFDFLGIETRKGLLGIYGISKENMQYATPNWNVSIDALASIPLPYFGDLDEDILLNINYDVYEKVDDVLIGKGDNWSSYDGRYTVKVETHRSYVGFQVVIYYKREPSQIISQLGVGRNGVVSVAMSGFEIYGNLVVQNDQNIINRKNLSARLPKYISPDGSQISSGSTSGSNLPPPPPPPAEPPVGLPSDIIDVPVNEETLPGGSESGGSPPPIVNTSTEYYTTVSVKTSSYTAASKQIIPCDTTAASFTITTPASGYFKVFDAVGLGEKTGFGVNPLYIQAATGTTIMGLTAPDRLILDVGAIGPEFILVGTDWRMVRSG